MIEIIADNIISPLGMTSEENYLQVKAGKSGLKKYEHAFGLPFACTASLMPDEFWKNFPDESEYTRFEQLAIRSIQGALDQVAQTSPVNMGDEHTLLILSTTKGNIDQLPDTERVILGNTARKIADYFHMHTLPMVVSNACISGVHALLIAKRMLEYQDYQKIIVCGCDVQSAFILSGFQSLRALSASACRPFDIDRNGLNLGEAAATMILSKTTEKREDGWYLAAGAVCNDAFHQTAPSPKGDGLAMAIRETLGDFPKEKLACVNAHGTSTLFNDEMEAVALHREGLDQVPVNSLKAYFGHTMGATGVLDTILTRYAVEDHTVLGTQGFEELGVSKKVNVVGKAVATEQHAFLKTIAGFGGCNGALLVAQGAVLPAEEEPVVLPHEKCDEQHYHEVLITPTSVCINGEVYPLASLQEKADEPVTGRTLLKQLYKKEIGNYSRFYKMDGLSQLGFVASELLLNQVYPHRQFDSNGKVTEETQGGEKAVILFSESGSVATDVKYEQSMHDIPSPHLFTYTLPNMVAGEIAIRNRYHGETGLFDRCCSEDTTPFIALALSFKWPLKGLENGIICGVVNWKSEDDFTAHLWLIDKTYD